MAMAGGGAAAPSGEVEAGFAKLQGEDFEYYMQTYSIILGRNSKKSAVDVDLSSLGGGMNISRHHARIFYDFQRRRFALDVIGKNGCLVEGVLHLPGNPPVKLDSQDLLQIGDKKFYFLLPTRSIFATAAAPRMVPPPYAVGTAKGRMRPAEDEEEEEEEDEEEDEEMGDERGYGVAAPTAAGGIKPGPSGILDKKSEARSRVDREADNHQLLQLEEKDVVSSVATVLSDLCGPGEWMPMAKLHSEKDRLLAIFNEEIASGAVKVRKIEKQNPKLKYAKKPQQKNSVDCGIYVCKYMEWLSMKSPYAIEQITERSIGQLRANLAYHIIIDKDYGWDENASSLRDKIIAGEAI